MMQEAARRQSWDERDLPSEVRAKLAPEIREESAAASAVSSAPDEGLHARAPRTVEAPDDVLKRLREFLVERPWTARLPEAVAFLDIPERSLQRALRAVGSGFRQEIDKVRAAEIADLLLGTADKVETIAGQLGVESSSLSRMFTRVMGESPVHFRARRKGEP